MEPASRAIQPAPRVQSRTKDAWSAFWQEPGQSRCAAGAPGIWQPVTAHWEAFATTLTRGSRVLDLGCGAGAVGRLLLGARDDLHLTGIDFARTPLVLDPKIELLSETPMESLPFAQDSFGAVVSQFGFEYGNRDETAQELARVMKPGARLSFLVHHADSAIVAGNRVRLSALIGLLKPGIRAAFCAGDAAEFMAQLVTLVEKHREDDLLADLARSLPSRLGRPPQERIAIWAAIEDALAPERCLGETLNEACVDPAEIDEWLAPLDRICELAPPVVLREADGTPIAWRISGAIPETLANRGS
jgi:SAM-dependent methyltransferase